MIKMPELKNFVIEFKDWDAYNAESKEEAIKKFRADHGNDAEITDILC